VGSLLPRDAGDLVKAPGSLRAPAQCQQEEEEGDELQDEEVQAGSLGPSPSLGDLVPSPSPAVTFPEDLHCAKVTIVSEEECRRVYSDSITANMVCAGESRSRADSCQVGPEGGPGRGEELRAENGHNSARAVETRRDMGLQGGRVEVVASPWWDFMGGDAWPALRRPQIWGDPLGWAVSPSPQLVVPPPFCPVRVTPGDPSCVTGGSRASSPGVPASAGTPRNPASTSTSANTPGGSRRP